MNKTTIRSSSLAAVLAGSMLTLAACGGSSSSTTHHATHHAPVKLYRVTLTGAAETAHGARAGRGSAVIAFHGSRKVCFRFAHLHGFAGPTLAEIQKGAKGKSGKVVVALSTASRLHHHGCRHVSSTLAAEIERTPHDYYVNVHSAQYPAGAVRGQL